MQYYIDNKLQSYPDFPSLLAIADILEKLNIETLALKLNWEKLIHLPAPSIIQVKGTGENLFYVLVQSAHESVIYLDNTGKKIQFSKEEFLNQWTGTCLLCNKTEKSEEINFDSKFKEKRQFVGLVTISILFFLIFIILDLNRVFISKGAKQLLFLSAFTLLKISGLTVSAILLCEIALVFTGGYFHGEINPVTLSALFFFLVLPIVSWIKVKPLLNQKKEHLFVRRSVLKIKSNPNVLRDLLSRSAIPVASLAQGHTLFLDKLFENGKSICR